MSTTNAYFADMRQVLCPVLVGREEELSDLVAFLERARGGQRGVVLITGEAGVGKAAHAREADAVGRTEGMTVLLGRAVAGRGPFRPSRGGDAVRVPHVGGRPGRHSSTRSGLRWARLVPEWRVDRPSGFADEGGALVMLGEAVVRLLRTPGAERGCVLVSRISTGPTPRP